MGLIKKICLVLLIVGYLLAGINHFIHPDGYLRIIPRYIPYHYLANILAGLFEILFALMLIAPKTRTWAAWGIILLLAAFLPVHIQMVLDAPFSLGSLRVTPLLAWARLVFQPVLMLWAGWYMRKS